MAPKNSRMSDDKFALAEKMKANPTRGEAAMWARLEKRRTGYRFGRQVPMLGYIVDFICERLRVVVEVDGPHHDEPEQRAHDDKRDRVLKGHGYVTVRIPTELTEAQHITATVAQVVGVLDERRDWRALRRGAKWRGGARTLKTHAQLDKERASKEARQKAYDDSCAEVERTREQWRASLRKDGDVHG